jgi:hypothetical protein
MLANHNERITPQFVSSALDMQEKIRVWVSRSNYNGFKEEENAGNRVVLKRRAKQIYQAAVVAPIIGFFYGMFMYGTFAGIIIAAIFGVCYLCYLLFSKPTIISIQWGNESPFFVTVDATGDKNDFKNVIEDLKYVLSTDPGTSL